MSVRFKKYQLKDKSEAPIRAVRLTEGNIQEVAEYITRNGGAAFVTDSRGTKRPRLRIKQLNFGENWGKRDWRVAQIGDFVGYKVWQEFNYEKLKNVDVREYFRIREDHFEASHQEVK